MEGQERSPGRIVGGGGGRLKFAAVVETVGRKPSIGAKTLLRPTRPPLAMKFVEARCAPASTGRFASAQLDTAFAVAPAVSTLQCDDQAHAHQAAPQQDEGSRFGNIKAGTVNVDWINIGDGVVVGFEPG